MKKIKPSIFTRSIKNNDSNLLALNSKKICSVNKYIPPISKEWKNNAYLFNFNKIKDLPIFDILLDKIITGYFISFFHIGKYKLLDIKSKYKKNKIFKFSRIDKNIKQIYVSKSELNFYNSKIIINLYVYNKQKMSLLRKINTIRLKSEKFFKNFLLLSALNITDNSNSYIKEIKFRRKRILYKLFSILEIYKLRFTLNQYKFQEKFIYILAKTLGKFYKKNRF